MDNKLDKLTAIQTNNMPMDNPRDICTHLCLAAHHAGNWQKDFGPNDLDIYVHAIEKLIMNERHKALQEMLDATTAERGAHFTSKQGEIMEYALKYSREVGSHPPLKEVADYFGISLSTASQHLSSIRQKIKNRLDHKYFRPEQKEPALQDWPEKSSDFPEWYKQSVEDGDKLKRD